MALHPFKVRSPYGVQVTRARDGQEDFLVRASRVFLYLGLFFSSLMSVRFGGGFTLGDILILVGIASAGVGSINAHQNRGVQRMGTTSPFVILAVLFLVLSGLLATGRALAPDGSLAVTVRLVAVVFVLPVALRAVLTERIYFRRALVAFGSGAAICGSGTVLQYFAGSSIIPGADVTNVGRFSGFAQSVSDTGAITALGVVIAIGLFAGYRGRKRVGALLILAFSAIGLLLSGSVSGLIAVFVGCLVLAIRRVVMVKHMVLIGVVGVVVLSFVATIQEKSNALDPFARVLQTLGLGENAAYNTSGSRISTYKAAIDGFLSNPVVGAGLDYGSTIADGKYPAHNLFLAASFGGGILLLLAIIFAVVRPFRGRWIGADRSIEVSIVVAMTVSALAFAMTAPSLFNRYLWIPMGLLLVMRHLSNTRKNATGHRDSEQALRTPRENAEL